MTRLPNELSAVEAALAIRSGELSATALRTACLDRIRQRDSVIRAWVVVDGAARTGMPSLPVAPDRAGPLYGIPVGIKDIIDCAGLPTAMGSPIHAGYRPVVDASCVALLRTAGADVLGKTVTTELAFVTANGTANPWNPAHSAGASSTGSAAAVADRMVPLALGTQTASSVTRPAAYCGVVGYKSSHGAFALAGIKSFAPSLDCLGAFSRSVEDLLVLRAAWRAGGFDLERRPVGQPPAMVGVWLAPFADRCDAETREVVRDSARILSRSGIQTVELPFGISLAELETLQRTVMAFEAARSYAAEWLRHRARLSTPLAALLEEGWACPPDRYAAALKRAGDARRAFAEACNGIDVVLTPSAPGVAPAGIDTIGDPICSRPWSLLGAATVTLPVALGDQALPLGVQFVVPRGRDEDLLLRCLALEKLLPAPPWPQPVAAVGPTPASG